MNIAAISNLALGSQVQDTRKEGHNMPSGAFAQLLDQANASSPEKDFLDFMKMTPAEKIQYSWLASHGITKEEFDAMGAEEKAKLIKQMEAEMREQIKKGMESSAASLF